MQWSQFSNVVTETYEGEITPPAKPLWPFADLVAGMHLTTPRQLAVSFLSGPQPDFQIASRIEYQVSTSAEFPDSDRASFMLVRNQDYSSGTTAMSPSGGVMTPNIPLFARARAELE